MDQYEADLVTDIVNARWRIRRIQRFETAAIDLQLDDTAPVMYEKYASVDIVTVETASFQDLAKNSRVLDVIHDYESRYYRIMERAQRDLQRYRQGRPERVSRQGLEPEKPAQGSADGEASSSGPVPKRISPSLNFWHRFLPTLLLAILLISCFSALENSSVTPSVLRRVGSFSAPTLNLPAAPPIAPMPPLSVRRGQEERPIHALTPPSRSGALLSANLARRG
jgi:hypothetical protein